MKNCAKCTDEFVQLMYIFILRKIVLQISSFKNGYCLNENNSVQNLYCVQSPVTDMTVYVVSIDSVSYTHLPKGVEIK